jgi:hypothetical protein
MSNQSVALQSAGGAIAAPQTESEAILSVISRAASDPSCDIEKMERLMQMHERMQAKQAEVAFAQALAEMQEHMPVIGERGAIKNKNGGVQSTYALWEDINEALKPVLTQYGFALSFRTNTGDGQVKVTGILSHRMGHREETDITLPSDVTGSKNAVQAVASSVSYGKRYTAGALLNLTSRGEDDDGQFAGQAPVKTITPAQIERLNSIALKCSDGVRKKFSSDWPDVSKVPADQYDAIANSLSGAAEKYQGKLKAEQAMKESEKEQTA